MIVVIVGAVVVVPFICIARRIVELLVMFMEPVMGLKPGGGVAIYV